MNRAVDPVRSRDAVPRALVRACALAIAATISVPAAAVETSILLSPTPSTMAEMAYAVGVDGTRVVLGAPGENDNAGALYVSECAMLPCAMPLRIAPADLAAGDTFGT